MKCANCQCGVESSYFRSGSLHWVNDAGDGINNRSQHAVWLCAECTAHYIFHTWRPAAEQLWALSTADSAAKIPAERPAQPTAYPRARVA